MLEHRTADGAARPAATSRQVPSADLRPLLDLVARLLAEEFRARTVFAPARASTQDE